MAVNEARSRCALILGMHRSGTSLCSAACSALGYQLGRIESYRDEENPQGYNENFDVVALNDRILMHLNSVWCSPGLMSQLDLSNDRILSFKSEAKALVRTFYGDSREFVLKDPRISLLLPFWEAVFEELSVDILPVLMTRHPSKVAVSQRRRHLRNDLVFPVGSMSEYTALVWFRYYQALSESNLKALIIDFDNFHVRPERELRRLADYLAVGCSAEVAEIFSEKVLVKSLNRSGRNKAYSGFDRTYINLKAMATGAPIQMSSLREVFKESAIAATDFLMPALTELNGLLVSRKELRDKIEVPLENRIRDLDSGLQQAEQLVKTQRIDFEVEFEQLQAGLLDAQRILDADRSMWAKERASLVLTAKECREEAESLQAGLLDAQRILDADRSMWAEERASLVLTAKECREEAESLQAGLLDAQRILDADRSMWAEERASLVLTAKECREEAESLQAGLLDAQRILDADRSMWAEERASLVLTAKECREEAESLQAGLLDAQRILDADRSMWAEERTKLTEDIEYLNNKIYCELIRFKQIRCLEVQHRHNVLRQAAVRK